VFGWTSIDTPVDQSPLQSIPWITAGTMAPVWSWHIYVTEISGFVLCEILGFCSSAVEIVVSSRIWCHVTGWLVPKVSRPLCFPQNARHLSHSDVAPYPRRTKTSNPALPSWGDWTHRCLTWMAWTVWRMVQLVLLHGAQYFLYSLSQWGVDVYKHITPVEHAGILSFYGSALQLCCALMAISGSWLTALWFCLVDYAPGIASI
jgi:hypothetical protein